MDPIQLRRVFLRFMRYNVVGIAMFFVDLAFVAILYYGFGFDYLAATILAFMMAMLGAFFLNRAWTFETNTQSWRAIIAVAVALVSLLIVSLCTYVGVEYIGLQYVLVRLVAAILATIWSYAADSLITFQVRLFK